MRVIAYRDPKMNGSVVDAEVAGQRTLVSCRPGLWARRMTLDAGDPAFRVRDVRVSELCD